MKSDKELLNICMDIYRDMYANSTPSADFDDLIETGETSKDNWFLNYELDEDKSKEIIDSHSKKHKLTKKEQQKISIEVHLGCAPKYKLK